MTPIILPALVRAISLVVYKASSGWKAAPALVDFADLLGWKHDGTFQGIFEAGQNSLPKDDQGNMLKIRAMGSDANHPYTQQMQQQGRKLLDEAFGQSGNTDTFHPRRPSYPWLLILSNWPADALPRVLELGKLLHRGLVFGEIVVLAGTHDGPIEKSLSTLLANGTLTPYLTQKVDPGTLPTSEMDSILWLLDNVLPASLLKGTPITVVPTPMINTSDGDTISPSTRSSLIEWRKHAGFGSRNARREPGDVLAIFNGWQWPRGRIIVQTELDSWGGFENYVVQTVGADPGFDHPFAVRVAEFNRYLYEVWHVLNPTTK